MMSLFIVLWLMNTSEKVRQAVAGYFNDPRGKSTQTGTDQSGTSENLALTENNIADLKKKIEEAIHKMNDLKALQNQIQITITPEGLRIELLETKDGTFFDTRQRDAEPERTGDAGNAGRAAGRHCRTAFRSKGTRMRSRMRQTMGMATGSLSTDRANAARRVMQASGLRKDQVSQVRGYADQKLRVPANPLDPSNRRISLIVQYLTVDAPPVPAAGSRLPARGRAAEGASGRGSRRAPRDVSARRRTAGASSRAQRRPGAGKARGRKTGGSESRRGRRAVAAGSQRRGRRRWRQRGERGCGNRLYRKSNDCAGAAKHGDPARGGARRWGIER